MSFKEILEELPGLTREQKRQLWIVLIFSQKPWDPKGRCRIIISIIAVVISLVLAFWPGQFWEHAAPDKHSTWWRAIALVAWSILPPLWFLAEYSLIFKTSNFKDLIKLNTDLESLSTYFEHLKYVQDLSSKFWAGMLAALTILYFGKDILTIDLFRRA